METVEITVSEETKRDLLSLCYALESWRHAQEALRRLRDEKLEPVDAMYEILTTAAVILYMRPFERSAGLRRLTEYERFDDFREGPFLKELHDALDKTRNQILAHQQITGWDKLMKGVPAVEPAGRLEVQFFPEFSYVVQTPSLHPAMIEGILLLLRIQVERGTAQFMAAVRAAMPPSSKGDRFRFEIRPNGAISPAQAI